MKRLAKDYWAPVLSKRNGNVDSFRFSNMNGSSLSQTSEENFATSLVQNRIQTSCLSSTDRQLRRQLFAAELELRRLRILAENERLHNEKAIEEKEKRIQILERDRRFLKEREAVAKENLLALENKFLAFRQEAEKQSQEQNKLVSRLTEDMNDYERDYLHCRSKLKLCEHQGVDDHRVVEASYAKVLEEMNLAKRQRDIAVNHANELQNELNSKRQAPQTSELRTFNPKSDGPLLRKLQYENRVLRESQEKFQILQEKVFGLEKQVADLQSKGVICEGGSTVNEKQDIAGAELQQLLQTTLQLMDTKERLGQIESDYKLLSLEMARLREENAKLSKGNQEQTPKLGDLEIKLRRSQQTENLLKTEIQGLKEQIQALERLDQSGQHVIASLNKRLRQQDIEFDK